MPSVRLLAVSAAEVIHGYNLGGAIVALEAVVVEPMIRAPTKPREAVVPRRGPEDGAQVVLCTRTQLVSVCRHRRRGNQFWSQKIASTYEEKVQRVVRDEEADQAASEVEHVLNRVHRQARPRPRGEVSANRSLTHTHTHTHTHTIHHNQTSTATARLVADVGRYSYPGLYDLWCSEWTCR